MIKARRIGHAVFETKDIERLSDHYTEVVGLVVAAKDRDRVYLASHLGHLAVELRSGPSVGCRKLSSALAHATASAHGEKALAKQGIRSERINDSAPGISSALKFADPKGTEIELFTAWKSLSDKQAAKGIAVVKLGHVAYFTPDLAKTIEFYSGVLGFKISDWIGDYFVFMRCNPDHHTVNFFKGDKAHLHHIAFELAD